MKIRTNENWPIKKLGDICEFMSGGTPRKSTDSYWQGSIPWVSGKDMKSDQISDTILSVSQSVSVSQSAVDDNKTRLAPTGAILILVRGMGLANGIRPAEILRPCAFLKKIIIPKPPLPQLRAIVQTLDALSAETRRLESIYQRKLDALAELKQSLLQRASAGEL